jgi:ubiquinone/menaquinone biosynthesis C-methylase UbiE
MQKGHKIVPYDIRNDSIPFGDNSVNTIYCSHVVEHIEDIHIQKMFNECYRVLLGGGVLRIVCPDAEFLYNMAKEDKAAAYWSWGDTCFNSPLFAGKYSGKNLPRIVDYLVRELAIPKLPGYAGYINAISNGDYAKAFREMEMYDFFEFLTKDLTFRVEYGGDHINYWTFDKMKKMLTKAGFDFVIQSRYGASCCPEMRQMHKFDLCAPFVSLYVEAIK